jgi:hypothetical protein
MTDGNGSPRGTGSAFSFTHRHMTARRAIGAAALCLLLIAPPRNAGAFPLSGDETVLPPGSELNEESLDRPREIFRSEAIGGVKSYLVNLGDLAFNSPAVLGGAARQAGMSCSTCHVNGAGNAKLYIPGMSNHPGNFDTTGPLFNPKANNGVRDPVRIPSLRGARYLAPYVMTGDRLRCGISSATSSSMNSPDRSRNQRSSMHWSSTSRISISCRILVSVRAGG